MESIQPQILTEAVRRLIHELFAGPSTAKSSYILNRTDEGLVPILEKLSGDQASAELIPGRATIAAHANHLAFSLELFNRWAAGENAFAEAKWEESWRVSRVDDGEWRALIGRLRTEAERWEHGVTGIREWPPVAVTGVIASAAHAAYHVGAVRQLIGLVRR